mmetsp:Transcript_25504/g.64020  ORF Transcript_25504/g.64020 Transcript_25504/m.64020 type:complete len:232 (-) Transcript_25504:869-1564(-)
MRAGRLRCAVAHPARVTHPSDAYVPPGWRAVRPDDRWHSAAPLRSARSAATWGASGARWPVACAPPRHPDAAVRSASSCRPGGSALRSAAAVPQGVDSGRRVPHAAGPSPAAQLRPHSRATQALRCGDRGGSRPHLASCGHRSSGPGRSRPPAARRGWSLHRRRSPASTPCSLWQRRPPPASGARDAVAGVALLRLRGRRSTRRARVLPHQSSHCHCVPLLRRADGHSGSA